ncbi:ABC transporter substrate-binding protein [Wukongibacter sp. M2B1]|uniref:ABC transporter substrate-binding protein n=1 Tax=Wukongibacter sp. M2B1 TaxID=3088895 RepID=UPI003D7BABEB
MNIKYRPFTLFLCLTLIVFILFAPHFMMRPKIDELVDKIFVKEIEWKGIITVWDYPRLDITTGYKYSWITKKIKEFERKNPGVYIEFKPLDSNFGHIKIDTALKSNSCPDIAPVGSNLEIIAKGALEPLDEYLTQEEIDKYKANAISAVKYDKRIWGVPYMMENYCLFLNLDLFNQKGVKPPESGNWTYEEFLKALKDLTYDSNGDKEVDIFGFNSYIMPNTYNAWGIILSDGGRIVDYKKGNYSFYGKEAVSGLKKLVDLKLVHKVTPEEFGTNTPMEAWRSFAVDKKVAVYPGKSSFVNVLKVLNNMGKGFNFGVANFPIGEAGVPISSGNTVTAYGIFKQDDKKKVEMCMKFIKHLTDDEGQKELNKQGVFPVRKDMEEIYKNDEIMSTIEKSLSYSKPIGVHPKWKEVDDILQTQIRMALLGKKTAEEAIRDAKERIEKAFSLGR